jgi:hypothetical protein
MEVWSFCSMCISAASVALLKILLPRHITCMVV